MFFKKTTNKAFSKLSNHGYGLAIIRVPDLVTEDLTYQNPEVMYMLAHEGTLLGLVPLGKTNIFQLIKMSSNVHFNAREPNDGDFEKLRLTLTQYGYTLKMSSEPKAKLASVTAIKKEDK